MKELETKGRSRKQRHHLFHKGMNQMKRLLSVCLCTSMISTSIGSTTALAATAPLLEKDEAEEENPNFVLDQDELSEALLKAVKGKPVKEDALSFEGEEAEAYETLFQEDGSLFELHPDVKVPDGKVNLKVYARLDEKEALDHYTITGEEEILFLLLNRSSEKEYGQIEVDGKLSGKVSILSAKELKKQVQDEETEAIEKMGVSNPNGAEEKSNETAGEPKKEENVKETDTQEPEKENPAETPENGDKSENPASEPEKGSETENPANEAGNGAEAENPANEPEKSPEAGSRNAEKTGTPEEKDSQPDADSGLEKEKNDSAGSEAGDVAQASRSDHFKMFLTAAPATASEMQAEDEISEKETNTDSQPDAETEVEIEDGAERLQGEAYESVLLKNTAAAAFVTTAAELGLSGSVDDAVYTVNTDSAVLTLTVPAGAFEEKVKLKAEEIKGGSEEHQTLSDQIHEEGYRADSFTAFDVKFVNEAGEEVEPSEEVKVSIQFKKNAVESETAENLEETKILHIHEDVITELSEVEIQDSTEDSEKTAKLTFGVNEFSILLALNEAATGVAEVNGTAYDTLEAAFAAAGDGDTVKVLKNCGLSKAISVDKDLTLDLNEKTVTVKIAPEERAAQTVNAFTVEAEKKLTVQNGKMFGTKGMNQRAIQANEKSVVSLNGVRFALFDSKTGNGGVVSMDKGTLEAESCEFGYADKNATPTSGRNKAQKGGAISAEDSILKIKNNRFLYNRAIRPFNEREYDDWSYYGGGSIYLFGSGTNANIEENYFYSNQTNAFGGCINLDQVGKAIIKKNEMLLADADPSNLMDDNGYWGYNKKDEHEQSGGAVYVRLSYDVSFIENRIDDCVALFNGGGIAVENGKDKGYTANFVNNEITNCHAVMGRGGALSLRMPQGCVLKLDGGKIVNNTAKFAGGGIDYTGHNMVPLELKNVVITENNAVRGAGIWGCPTSQTKINSTLGGSIYGNVASGMTTTALCICSGSGDEIRYEGSDSQDTWATYYYPSESTTMTVSKRTAGGGLMHWYQDEAEARYQEGNVEATPELYTNTNKSFGLHGELSKEHQLLAEENAQLLIKGNKVKTGRGGGIATNSPLIIGLEDADVTVEVTKKWTEETHPDQVYVDLYRVGDTSGEKVKLDSHVELNAENNWSASFEDLPSKCVSNGEVEDCHYIVEEEALEGWKESSSTEYDKENKTYHITLTNAPIQYGSLTVSKEVTGSGDKEKAFPFKVTLQGDTVLNGIYGDMEFVDNVATFTLKHGESKSAAGLPEGTAYTVEESGNEGYTVTKTGDVGTIAGGETAVVKFVNAMSGGDNPTPTPDHNGGGGHGGHGGGSSSGSRKSSTTTTSGPAAEPTEPVAPVEPEPQPVVPEEGLPKTGEDPMNVPMAALTVGMMAAAYVLMTGRKKTEK